MKWFGNPLLLASLCLSATTAYASQQQQQRLASPPTQKKQRDTVRRLKGKGGGEKGRKGGGEGRTTSRTNSISTTRTNSYTTPGVVTPGIATNTLRTNTNINNNAYNTINTPLTPAVQTRTPLACTATVRIDCTLSNGAACETYTTAAAQCGTTERITLTYNACNTGTAAAMTITEFSLVDGSLDLVAGTNLNPVPPGACAQAQTAQEIPNICAGVTFGTGALLRAVSDTSVPCADGSTIEVIFPPAATGGVPDVPRLPATPFAGNPFPATTTPMVPDNSFTGTMGVGSGTGTMGAGTGTMAAGGGACTVSVDISCVLADSVTPCASMGVRNAPDCSVGVFFTVTICNTGSATAEITGALFDFDGFSTDALQAGQVPVTTLPAQPQGCITLEPNTQVDACTAGRSTTAGFSVTASSGGGPSCAGQDIVTF